MDYKDHNYRTCDEWMQIIQECRTSGMSDTAWCHQNNVPVSSFYSAIRRCRNRACAIPETSVTVRSESQEVVPVTFNESITTYPTCSELQDSAINPSVQIIVNDYKIQITNHCARETIQNILLAVREIC